MIGNRRQLAEENQTNYECAVDVKYQHFELRQRLRLGHGCIFAQCGGPVPRDSEDVSLFYKLM